MESAVDRTTVQLLRIWLLVLLAVLLPIRGAMAAAMVCPPAGGTPMQQASQHQTGHDDHGAHAHGQAGDAHDSEQGSDHAHASGPDKCNMCSASCSTPPLPSAVSGIAPGDLTPVAFPDLHTPAPTFQSDGQERPPRTI